MIRVAYCDDDPSTLNQLSHLLDKYREERNLSLQHTPYRSALDLLAVNAGIKMSPIYYLMFIGTKRMYG